MKILFIFYHGENIFKGPGSSYSVKYFFLTGIRTFVFNSFNFFNLNVIGELPTLLTIQNTNLPRN
jgi:hypothetical protein